MDTENQIFVRDLENMIPVTSKEIQFNTQIPLYDDSDDESAPMVIKYVEKST